MFKFRPAIAASVLTTALFLPAVAQQPAATAATTAPAVPMPGTPGLFVSNQQLSTLLNAAATGSAVPAVAEVAVTDQYAIHEVRRSKPGPAAIHLGWSEVHLVLAGSGTLVTGGKMTQAPSGGNTIEGGESHALKKGDVFIIPANTPHMYSKVDDLTYFEVRFATADPAGSGK